MHIRFNRTVAAIYYGAWMVTSGAGLGLLNSCGSDQGSNEVRGQTDATAAQNTNASAGSIDASEGSTEIDASILNTEVLGESSDSDKTDTLTHPNGDAGGRIEVGGGTSVDAAVNIDASKAGTNGSSYAFSIYLLKDSSIPGSDLRQKDTNSVELQGNPVLTESDIAYYSWPRHAFSLSKQSAVSFQRPSTNGRPFVVVSGGQRQYLGAFWVAYSSMSYNGPVIDVTFTGAARSYLIENGYPGSIQGSLDVRDNATIKQALKEAGKLVEEPLPPSMKGYEVYSWDNGSNGWQFTLVTGTNRNKSCAEVTTDPDSESADGWVNITNAGVDAFKATLARLPKGESLFWWSGLQGCDSLGMPGSDVVDEIESHCAVFGLELTTP